MLYEETAWTTTCPVSGSAEHYIELALPGSFPSLQAGFCSSYMRFVIPAIVTIWSEVRFVTSLCVNIDPVLTVAYYQDN